VRNNVREHPQRSDHRQQGSIRRFSSSYTLPHFASTHARFAHNDISCENINLHRYAPLFSVNYDGFSVLCFDYMPLIRPSAASQISYVGTNNTVTDLPPLRETISSIQPHVSTDLYLLTRSCLTVVCAAWSAISYTEMKNSMHERKNFFSACMKFFCTNAEYAKVQRIYPYSTISEFLTAIHTALPTRQVRIVSPYHRNLHLKFPPVDTWHAQDIVNLVASKTATKPTAYSLRLPQSQIHNIACSIDVHNACERLLADKSQDRSKDVALARSEVPILLYITDIFPELYDALMSEPVSTRETIGSWAEANLPSA
jgi:hypothetical protein